MENFTGSPQEIAKLYTFCLILEVISFHYKYINVLHPLSVSPDSVLFCIHFEGFEDFICFIARK